MTKKQARKKPGYTPKGAGATSKGNSQALLWVFLIVALAIAGGVYYFKFYQPSGGPTVTTQSGLKYIDVASGTGASPAPGSTVTVHYTGTLENGAKFDSSVDRGTPYTFVIGRGQVIRGWDEGVMSMKVGGKRKLIIPPDLGYGPSGQGAIPPNATLLFDVELLDVK